jgi:trehalose utilization protein
MPIGVTVWNENVHEQKDERVAAINPSGIHGAIAEGLRDQLGDRADVRTATQDQPRTG